MPEADSVPGYYAPVHRALTEPILLGGAPRAVAILNGTLAAAIGLGLRLWLAGAAIWLIGHLAAVWAAKRDPAFVEVVRPEAESLDDAATLTYLHSCVSTRRQFVRVPETPMHLDAILIDEDLAIAGSVLV
jgi:type IV secretion system protein TrbD